jgi:hypothetical protein
VPRGGKLGGFTAHRPCCSIRKFQEGDCKVILPNRAGLWICLSGTRYQGNHAHTAKLCDLLFIWDRSGKETVSSVLELKGGGVDVTGVVQQLQNGANIVASLVQEADLEFLPVLVHRAISSVQSRELAKRKIKFRGEQIPIALLRCGGKVSELRW